MSADNAEGGKVTESASVEEVEDPVTMTVSAEVHPDGKAIDVLVDGEKAGEVAIEDEPFEPIELTNGVTINADTVLQCGKCGARFYAKDVRTEDGSCPATNEAQTVVCGGVLGPIQV